MSNQYIVQVSNIKKTYALGDTKIRALRGIDLNIKKGKFVSIIGSSGCGKTTLLNLIGCLDVPDSDSGKIIINDKDVGAMADNPLTEFRGAHIGFIFQNFNLVPVLNVKENIEYPLMLRKKTPYEISKKEMKERVDFIIESVGLNEWSTHKPKELSGGQRQRVAIARALIGYPQLVIADEPTANLDTETSLNIMELMSKLQKEFHTTFIFATHDFRFIDYIDIIYEIKDGVIIGMQTSKEFKTLKEMRVQL